MRNKITHFIRRLSFPLLGCAIVLVLAEISARFLDSKYHFHYKTQLILSQIDQKSRPLKADHQLPWPPRTLYIRAPEPADIPETPYIVGGRTIPGAYHQLKMMMVSPQMLPQNSRKRIFIVGGSAAFGFPYLYPYSFGDILQKSLGSDDYHVINAAQISFSSGQLVPIVKRIVDYYQPAVLIIMTGNNEWSGWQPEHARDHLVKSVKIFRVLSRSRFLSWILYENLKSAYSRKRNTRRPQKEFEIQKEIEGYTYAQANPYRNFFDNDPRTLFASKETFLSTFKENLTEMITYAKQRSVRVILLNIPFNYKLSPAFMHPQPLWFNPSHKETVQRDLNSIISLIENEKYHKAIKTITQTLTLEPDAPLLHYLKGYALEKTGFFLRAEESYARSRETMVGHLGSRLSINAEIERVAKETKAEFLDLKKIFDDYEHAQGHFFNKNLILDDCHPSPIGHQIIAEALHKIIRKNEIE